MSDILNPVAGDVFSLPRGEIRIDRVGNGQVYFMRWRDDEEIGEPARMTIETWREAVKADAAKVAAWQKILSERRT